MNADVRAELDLMRDTLGTRRARGVETADPTASLWEIYCYGLGYVRLIQQYLDRNELAAEDWRMASTHLPGVAEDIEWHMRELKKLLDRYLRLAGRALHEDAS